MIDQSRTRNTPGTLRAVMIVLAVTAGWVLFEWLFFVTKPSFMSLYPAWEKFGVLSSTVLIATACLLVITVPFAGLGWLLSRVGAPAPIVFAATLLPTIVLLALSMLVAIDNFSLTLLGWGVRNAEGTAVYVYRLLTVALVLLAGRLLSGFWSDRYPIVLLKSLGFAAVLLSLVGLFFLALNTRSEEGEAGLSIGLTASRHNIVILTGDGISAKHMSLYGYERPTTPFLDNVRDEFLVAENHFTNASDTGGSVISLLTGKLPTTTRVVYPPDALRGDDSFQHLPGILGKLGYYSADISMRHYADPYDLNLRNGFAEANFRRLEASGGLLVAAVRRIAHNFTALNPASLMFERMSERMSERYAHIWKGQKMQDPFAEVNVPERRWVRDGDRMEEIRRLISQAPQPFFVHVLTMGTHGERFRPSRRVYSTEADYQTPWNVDGYDDAIMDFDRFVQAVYEDLRARGLLESTLLIVSSDHGFVHSALDRVPMMMRLPGKSRSGFIGGNTQRLDLAPTVLDVLGLKAPPWMEGVSMIEADPSQTRFRPVFASGSRGDKAVVGKFWSVNNPTPPWYSLGRLSVVHCNQAFMLQLEPMEISASTVEGSTASCDVQLSIDQAKDLLLAHLKEKGYSW